VRVRACVRVCVRVRARARACVRERERERERDSRIEALIQCLIVNLQLYSLRASARNAKLIRIDDTWECGSICDRSNVNVGTIRIRDAIYWQSEYNGISVIRSKMLYHSRQNILAFEIF